MKRIQGKFYIAFRYVMRMGRWSSRSSRARKIKRVMGQEAWNMLYGEQEREVQGFFRI